MIYYKVKPEYDQTYKNPRIHNTNILVKNDLYTEAERKKCLSYPKSALTSWRSRAEKPDFSSE